MKHINADACKRLWQSVLLAEIRVATGNSKDREDAQRYLLNKSRVAEAVTLAGFDPDTFVAAMFALADRDWQQS